MKHELKVGYRVIRQLDGANLAAGETPLSYTSDVFDFDQEQDKQKAISDFKDKITKKYPFSDVFVWTIH